MKKTNKILVVCLSSIYVLTTLLTSSTLFPTKVKAMDFIKTNPMQGNTKALPEVKNITTVSKDMISIKIHQGFFEKSQIYAYPSAIEGRIFKDSSGKKWIIVPATKYGAAIHIDDIVASKIKISSVDDAAYAKPVTPTTIYKKRKVTGGTTIAGRDYATETEVFVKLPTSLKENSTYVVDTSSLKTFNGKYQFKYTPKALRSEAVHVSQVGFRPSDPAKVAFLSLWMGDGAGAQFDPKINFEILDATTLESVYQGTTKDVWKTTDTNYYLWGGNSVDKDGNKLQGKNRNFNFTDVNRFDFSDFNKPGKYVVYVDGVGCSYPFEIYGNTWEKAFKKSMQGYLHQRSGIAFDLSFADFVRPATFMPSLGMKIYETGATAVDTGNGLKALKTTPAGKTNEGNFILINELATTTIAKDVTGSPNGLYGGYYDAGDWDRRIQHLQPSNGQLELALMYPEYFKDLKLSLPADEANDNIPDILNEVMWNLDFYKRLQTPEGGVRGGIESSEHPNEGEPSWMESLNVYVYSPDAWSSFIYAASATRFAYVCKTFAEKFPTELGHLANKIPEYRDTAIKALEWGTKDLDARNAKKNLYDTNALNTIKAWKAAAAVELYRLTGESKYHDIFVSNYNASLEAYDGFDTEYAAVYIDCDNKGLEINESKLSSAKKILKEVVDAEVKQVNGNAFYIAHGGKKAPYKPIGYSGFFATPHVYGSIRSYYLTKDDPTKQEENTQYLQTIIKATSSGAGANPNNMCYTSNVGVNSVTGVFYLDVWYAGKSIPTGITVTGPHSPYDYHDDGWYQTLKYSMYPNGDTFPEAETYSDAGLSPIQNEYTVQQSMAGLNYTWGFLAARPSSPEEKSEEVPVERYDSGILKVKNVTVKGLKATYYNSTNFKKAVTTKTVKKISSNWGKKAPTKGVNKDNFSIRYSGKVKANASETVTFTVKTTGGVRLFVGGKKLINSWKTSNKAKTLSKTFKMKKGKAYTIKLEYMSKKESASVKLTWTGKKFKNKVITNKNLYYTKQVTSVVK